MEAKWSLGISNHVTFECIKTKEMKAGSHQTCAQDLWKYISKYWEEDSYDSTVGSENENG